MLTNKDRIITYLQTYSSKDNAKSIPDIAETLSIDEASVGYIIHELLLSNLVFTKNSIGKYNLLYYIQPQ